MPRLDSYSIGALQSLFFGGERAASESSAPGQHLGGHLHRQARFRSWTGSPLERGAYQIFQMASVGCGFDLILKRGWMVMVSRFSLELDNQPVLVIAANLS